MSYVVADIGGTTLRIGRATDQGVEAVRRVATEGLGRYPGEAPSRLQRLVMAQLAMELDDYLRSPDGLGTSAVGLSFAGPITSDGVAIAAPTIWGSASTPLRVGELLAQRLDVPVIVANDITAAAWRYAATEDEPFCLYTVSSGIGTKVFRHGEVLIGDDGSGGELGHWRVDPRPDAVRCDCGGLGHLGAIASGRGILAAARRAAADRPRESLLPAEITNEALAAAIRHGDAFAVDLLRAALQPLASAVACVFASIGIRRHLFIGGFAVAVGEKFTEVLADELVRLGCFGLTPAQTRAMVRLGFADDDHSLIGMGQLLTRSRSMDAYAGHR